MVLYMGTTTNGTCAICERSFKTQGGQLSLHGFRRPSCFGSKRIAYEINTSACEEYKAHVAERAIPQAEGWVSRIETGVTTTFVTFSGKKANPGDHGYERAREHELDAAKGHLSRLRREGARMDKKIADWKPAA
jgi:hypothetical protein